MGFSLILKIIASIGTILTGFISLISPRSVTGFTGLTATGQRGISEIRAVLGGVFIGLGLAPFLLKQPVTYRVLGIMYLTVAIVRTFSILFDKSFERSNIINVIIEFLFGIILVI